MANNRNFFKTIITTASTLALAMGSAGEAGAAAVQLSTANSHTGGQSWGANPGTDVFVSGNSVLLHAAGDNIVINSAVNVAGIDLNGLTPTGTITATASGGTLGAVSNGAGTIPLNINDGVALTLSGTATVAGVVAAYDYGGLGSVTLGSSNTGAAATLTITGSAGGIPTYYFAINSVTGAANPGILTINNAVLFQNATIGGTAPLSAINITNDGAWVAGLTSATSAAINLTSGTSGVRFWAGTITGDIHNTSSAVGTTAVNVNGGDTILKGSIGAGTNANTWISALNFATNHKLTLDATAAARSVYAPILNTVGADARGVLALSGTNNITLFSNIGANGAALACISFTGDNKLIIDSTSGVRDIYSVIENDGTAGQGTLSTTGSNNMIFHNFVGAVGILGAVDLTANTGGTITFNRYVHATTIKAGARPVVFAATVDNVMANIQLTNAASQITFASNTGPYTGAITNTTGVSSKGTVTISTNNVTFANGSTVGATGSGALAAINFATDNSLTLQGTIIYSPIHTTTGGTGSLVISTNNSTIHGDIGETNKALALVNIATGNSLIVDGNIYATATTLSNAAANLTIIGGGIGTERQIFGTIKGNDAGNGQGTITVGNGTVGNVQFREVLGGTNNLQLLTVADGSSAALFANATFRPLANGAAGSAGIHIGNNATLIVGQPYISTANGGPTAAVASTLTLNNGATIDGAGPIAGTNGVGKGVLVMVINNLPLSALPGVAAVPVGEHGRLQSIQMHAFTGGPSSLNAQAYTDTLDLTHGSAIRLDTNSITNNGTMPTSVTSSDDPTAVDYIISHAYIGNSDLTIGNLNNVATHISTTNKLTAASATVPSVIFSADGTFQTNGAGAIASITNTSGVAAGTFTATLTGAAATLNLTGPIGGAGNASLKALNFTGIDPTQTQVNIGTATDIYAQTILHKSMNLHVNTRNVNIHAATSYTMDGRTTPAELDVGDFSTTITAPGGTVLLQGDIVINANYTDANHVAIDLSGVQSINSTSLNSITFNIGAHTNMPMQNAVMTMIKKPAGMQLNANAQLMVTSFAGSNNLWSINGDGQIIYNYISAPSNLNTSQQNQSSVVPTPGNPNGPNPNFVPTAQFITSAASLGGNVHIGSDGKLAFQTSGPLQNGPVLPNGTALQIGPNVIGARPGQLVLNVFGGDIPMQAGSFGFIPTGLNNSTNALSSISVHPEIATFAQKALQQFPTPNDRLNVQKDLGQIFIDNPDGFIPQGTGVFLAATMVADGKMPSGMADKIFNPEGVPSDLLQNMIKVAGINGAEGAQKMYHDLTQAPTDIAFNDTSTRLTFVNIAPLPTFTPTPTPAPTGGQAGASTGATSNSTTASPAARTGAAGAVSSSIGNAEEETAEPGDDLQAVAYGTAAGDSPYDKFGVWSSINAGTARQKFNKGNPGFRSVSKGIAIGVDTMISDRVSVGLTISNSMNNMKHKDSALGNKTDSSSWVGAIYANRQLKNNWFIRGTALFNRTHINNKALKLVPAGSGIAQAKYNAISYGGEASIGFAHTFRNQIVATPSIGIRMIHNNKTSYTEQGNTAQNSTISSNAMNNYNALAGLSVSKTMMLHGISLTPEAHVNVQYGLNMQAPKGAFISPLTPTLTTSFVGTKSSKVTSTYGIGLTGSQDRFEVGVSGGMSISDKYVGYTGSLKLKVKF